MPADTHTPIHCQRHDQEQAIQPIRRPESGILQLKTSTLEVGKQRFDRPPGPVIPHGGFGRLTLHRDNPGCLMPGFLQNAQVGRYPAGKQPHVGQVAFADSLRQFARSGFTDAGIDRQVAFQPEAVLPAVPMQPGKQRGGGIEPVSQQ